jgi:hypothetical protein
VRGDVIGLEDSVEDSDSGRLIFFSVPVEKRKDNRRLFVASLLRMTGQVGEVRV